MVIGRGSPPAQAKLQQIRNSLIPAVQLVMLEAHMALLLLNVMGSAALASAVVVGIMASRLSREMAGVDTRAPAEAENHPQRDGLAL